MAAVKNMTSGNPAKLIFTFAIPLMLGNMFQQFYTVTDTVIVSRGLGVQALAALGSVDWYVYLILGIIQAITQGFAILVAQRFGAGDEAALRRAYWQALIMSVLFGALLTVLSIVSVFPAMPLLQVPMEIRPMARTYVLILFAGVPAQMLLNFTASMLRALGNSRTPLQAMIVSSVMNIALDLLFVLVFHWGVAGAAAATVMAQLMAGAWCTKTMLSIPAFSLRRKDGSAREAEAGLRMQMMRLSSPLILQNFLISVGGIIVVHVVNGLGVNFIAGYTATNKLYGMLEGAGIAYGFAMVTYIGQNYGAQRWDRIRKGYKAAMLIGFATSALISIVMIILGHQIGEIFLPGATADVLEARKTAYQYLVIMAAGLPILYVLHVTRSTLQGLGDTVTTMASGIAEFVMRTFMALVVSRFLGGTSIMYGEVAAWLGADLVLVRSLILHLRGAGNPDVPEE